MFLILEYQIPFAFGILFPGFALNMRHINRLSLSSKTSNLTFFKCTSKYLIGQHFDFFLEM